MIRRPPRSTQSRSSAASDVYKRQTTPLYRRADCALDGETGDFSCQAHCSQIPRGYGNSQPSKTERKRWIACGISGLMGLDGSVGNRLRHYWKNIQTNCRWWPSTTSPTPIHWLICSSTIPTMVASTERCGPKKVLWSWRGTAVSYTHLRAHETRHDLVC